MTSSSADIAVSVTQLLESNVPVVSSEWLNANLGSSNVKVVDASWYMPHEQRNPFEEYKVARIPGAVFFDIDRISDVASNLPHMLPSEEAFAAAISALGITNTDTVIVYDGKGIFSAPRVWWMFRVLGHDKVWVLNGGFPQWRASGFQVESTFTADELSKAIAASEIVQKFYHGLPVGPVMYKTKYQPQLVWTIEQIKGNIKARTHQHVDARSRGRFDGVDPEPREGIKSGHIPESKCVPFPQMLDSSQMLLPKDELCNKFVQGGISLDEPIVASCGTGVTACILALGLFYVGKPDVPVYDGSWTEWATQLDTEIVALTPSS